MWIIFNNLYNNNNNNNYYNKVMASNSYYSLFISITYGIVSKYIYFRLYI